MFNKIKKLKYEYALKNLSDIDYFDIDVYNNFIDLYNKYLTKGAEIKPVPSPSLGSAGAAETYDINTAKSYIDHLYLMHSLRVSNFKKFEWLQSFTLDRLAGIINSKNKIDIINPKLDSNQLNWIKNNKLN